MKAHLFAISIITMACDATTPMHAMGAAVPEPLFLFLTGRVQPGQVQRGGGERQDRMIPYVHRI